MTGKSLPDAPQSITVLGAGIVGVATASYLQRDGHAVTLIDRLDPGEYCSFGNAGLLCPSFCVPLVLPGTLGKLAHWLTDPAGPLTVRWSYLPRLAPWLLAALKTTRADRWIAIADALHALLAPTFDSYRALVERAGVPELVRRDGYLIVYEHEQTWRKEALEWEIRRERGVRFEEVDRAALRELEPSIRDIFVRGVFMPDEGHVTNPLRLTQSLVRQFVADGGRVLRRDVLDFEIGVEGPRAMLTDAGRLDLQTLVVAAGIHSAHLSAKLGSPVPLETQRGYHAHIHGPSVEVQRPTMPAEGKFFATPMEDGLRLAGTVEFAGVEAPPNEARVKAILTRARRMLPELAGSRISRWMGHRPCLPDSLPVIGRSPVFKNVFYAFGHGHLGLSTGATTGKLIADLLAGRPTAIDVTPYRVDRFGD